MKLRFLTLFLLLLSLGIVACASGDLIEQLPTAVPPANEPGSWAVGFAYDFPAGFWGEGQHRYAFNVDCPLLPEAAISAEWRFLDVSAEAGLRPEPVYLRVRGLSANPISDYLPQAVINPQQETTAVVYLIGFTREEAENVRAECEPIVAWDQQIPRPMSALDLFQP